MAGNLSDCPLVIWARRDWSQAQQTSTCRHVGYTEGLHKSHFQHLTEAWVATKSWEISTWILRNMNKLIWLVTEVWTELTKEAKSIKSKCIHLLPKVKNDCWTRLLLPYQPDRCWKPPAWSLLWCGSPGRKRSQHERCWSTPEFKDKESMSKGSQRRRTQKLKNTCGFRTVTSTHDQVVSTVMTNEVNSAINRKDLCECTDTSVLQNKSRAEEVEVLPLLCSRELLNFLHNIKTA